VTGSWCLEVTRFVVVQGDRTTLLFRLRAMEHAFESILDEITVASRLRSR
jgi:hypothetical protein